MISSYHFFNFNLLFISIFSPHPTCYATADFINLSAFVGCKKRFECTNHDDFILLIISKSLKPFFSIFCTQYNRNKNALGTVIFCYMRRLALPFYFSLIPMLFLHKCPTKTFESTAFNKTLHTTKEYVLFISFKSF